MPLENAVTIETQLLIRRPQATVFNAFIDPAVTTSFWFTHSSGKLLPGTTVTWEWEMYGVSTDVRVLEIIPEKKIKFEWGVPATTVEFAFLAMDQHTLVVIKNYGFNLSGDELIQAVKDNTGGFTTVLDGAKAYLEHNLKLNLIADKFPMGK